MGINQNTQQQKDKTMKEGEWETKEDGFMDESVCGRKCCRVFNMSFYVIGIKSINHGVLVFD